MSVSQSNTKSIKRDKMENFSNLSQSITNDIKRDTIIHVRLSQKIKEKLEEVAREEETSVSSIIRRAIKEFLRRREVNAED